MICALFGFLCGYYIPKYEHHHQEEIVVDNQINYFDYLIEEKQGFASDCNTILQILCDNYLHRLHTGESPTIPVEIIQGGTIAFRDSVRLDSVSSIAPLMGTLYNEYVNLQDTANVFSSVRMVFLSGDTIAVCKENPLYRLSMSLKCFETTEKKGLYKKKANRVVAILNDHDELLQQIDNSDFENATTNKNVGLESVEYYLWLYKSIDKKIGNLAY